jgi:hypothetical protein
LTRLTSRRHQRRITAVPTNPKANAKTGIVISVRLPPPAMLAENGTGLQPEASPERTCFKRRNDVVGKAKRGGTGSRRQQRVGPDP